MLKDLGFCISIPRFSYGSSTTSTSTTENNDKSQNSDESDNTNGDKGNTAMLYAGTRRKSKKKMHYLYNLYVPNTIPHSGTEIQLQRERHLNHRERERERVEIFTNFQILIYISHNKKTICLIRRRRRAFSLIIYTILTLYYSTQWHGNLNYSERDRQTVRERE